MRQKTTGALLEKAPDLRRLLDLLARTERGAFVAALSDEQERALALCLQPAVAIARCLLELGRGLLERPELAIDIDGGVRWQAEDGGAWLRLVRELTGYRGRLSFFLHGPELSLWDTPARGFAPAGDETVSLLGRIPLGRALSGRRPDLVVLFHPVLVEPRWYSPDGLPAVPDGVPVVVASCSFEEMAGDRAFLHVRGWRGCSPPVPNRHHPWYGPPRQMRFATPFRYLWSLGKRGAEEPEAARALAAELALMLGLNAAGAAFWIDLPVGAWRTVGDSPMVNLGTGLWASPRPEGSAELFRRWRSAGVSRIARVGTIALPRANCALLDALIRKEDEGAWCEEAMLAAAAARREILAALRPALSSPLRFRDALQALERGGLAPLSAADPLLVLRRDPGGRTLFWHAAARGDHAAMALLAERGADLNAADAVEGWSPLFLRADAGDLEGVRWLLSRGANPYVPVQAVGGTLLGMLLDLLAQRGRGEMAGFIEENDERLAPAVSW